ncbi:MAG: hypothetical protein KKG99_05505 [Bacteroidetes bacterium]|nr:hypothetical protein [Bacteroidota bacterium]
MKKSVLILVGLVLLFASCNSSKKNLIHGNYDEIIDRSVKKLIKSPDSNKDAILLDKSFKLANDRDLEAIKFLKQEAKADNWDKILMHYDMLKRRQNQIKPISPFMLNGQLTQYQYFDYDGEIIRAKTNAAAYFYANGKRLVESPDKMLIRQAFSEFLRVKNYAGSAYPDIDDLLQEAKFNGISRVMVQIKNMSQYNFQPEFIERITSGNISQLNSDWVQFFFDDSDEQIDFDYLTIVNLLNIQVSPDDTKTTDRIHKKNVEDGFDYILDAKGNVKKDTLGNDIKIKKIKEIQCAVVETAQVKEARLDGEIELYELYPVNRLVRKEPIGAQNIFRHLSYRAIGDVNALDSETQRKINAKPVPFPRDEELIYDNAIKVQEAIYQVLRSNQNYFR